MLKSERSSKKWWTQYTRYLINKYEGADIDRSIIIDTVQMVLRVATDSANRCSVHVRQVLLGYQIRWLKGEKTQRFDNHLCTLPQDTDVTG